MNDKIKVITDYKYFLKENNIRLPEDLKEKRKLFIDYFIRQNQEANITQNINELASNYLYVSTRTIEDILFYK